MTEETLSDKIVSNMVETDWYNDGEGTPKAWTNIPSIFVKDVKNFIKKLKEKLTKGSGLSLNDINKLAGKELV